jgi:hypothetical protein
MNDLLTEQIIQKLHDLPFTKKKAILELMKEDFTTILKDSEELEKWRNELLNTSVWSESEIENIYRAKDYINQGKPTQFF